MVLRGAAGWCLFNFVERRQADVCDSGVLGDHYADMDDDASGSSQAFTGDGEELVFKEGYVETNGRKKRKTGAEDQDYLPPGTKRVRIQKLSFVSLPYVRLSVPRVVILHEENKMSAPSSL